MRIVIGLLVLASLATAQMTKEQRLQDFRQLASLYAKNYAPYEWKKQTQKFDALEIAPFLARVERAKNDLEFYDICIDYVAGLNDAHSGFELPSDFRATLGFGVDLWDNAIVVDSINRTRLPANQYPIAIGDELISIDGVPAEQLLFQFAKYAVGANNRSTARIAAAYITSRAQAVIPRAVEVGDSATVVLKSASGEEKTMTIPWVKTGTPLYSAGPVPSPKTGAPAKARVDAQTLLFEDDKPYMLPLRMAQNAKVRHPEAIVGWGSRAPVFAMPSNFQQRLGRASADVFYSGTYEADGLKIGFIRIPSYSPSNQSAALQQFLTEIVYFQANTDGLIIDDTRNPGGSVCYLETLMSMIMPQPFRVLGYQLRATSFWVQQFSLGLDYARSAGAPDDIVAVYENLLKEVKDANAKDRGMTGPLPLCAETLIAEPLTDSRGNTVAYTKPVMLLVDDLSASGGDAFPAIFQDNKRGVIFGFRTMGAGGTVVGFDSGTFGEGYATATTSLMNRKESVVTTDFPAAPYVENIGVRPDIEWDYQLRENLMNSGRPYVERFTGFMIDHIRKNQ